MVLVCMVPAFHACMHVPMCAIMHTNTNHDTANTYTQNHQHHKHDKHHKRHKRHKRHKHHKHHKHQPSTPRGLAAKPARKHARKHAPTSAGCIRATVSARGTAGALSGHAWHPTTAAIRIILSNVVRETYQFVTQCSMYDDVT